MSTQRQTAIKLLPPSDYKLPLGEQAVRTEPSRMGGDKIKGKKKTLKGLVCNRLPYQPIHQDAVSLDALNLTYFKFLANGSKSIINISQMNH